MEYGTFVGLSWGAVFLSYVWGVSYNSAMLQLLCFALCGVAVMLPLVLAMRLNRKMFFIGEKLSYWQGLLFSFSMLMYACMMNGLITFVYFNYLDDGLLYEQLSSMMTQPEMVGMYEQMGMGEQYSQMMSMLDELDGLSALEKAMAIFNNNFFCSIFASFVVAVVASYDLKKLRNKK